jgi:hypothetical protein
MDQTDDVANTENLVAAPARCRLIERLDVQCSLIDSANEFAFSIDFRQQ